MTWPLSQDYNEAIQSPKSNFADPDLRRGEAVANALGLPMPYSGNFADVYQVRCRDGSSWAVKCFTRQAEGLRERYQEISRHLRQAKLPFTVDFTYLEQGIRVAGTWYPVLKMQWVEGLTLNQFVAQSLDKPAMLEALSQVWGRMAKHLRAAEVGHCDLQHGNVLMVPGASAKSLALKLIDYDGMWVPSLAGTKSGEVGHPSYQHPQRLREETYNIEVDRFPLLLIATTLRALKVKGKALWEKYDNGDNLLFKEMDLREPGASELFRELPQLGDPLTAALTAHMLKALGAKLDATPLLEEATPGARTATPAPTRTSRPAATPTPKTAAVAPVVAGVARVVAPAEDKTFAFDDSAVATAGTSSAGLKRAMPKARAKSGGVPAWTWAVAAAALLVVLGGAAAAFFATQSGPGNPPAGPAVTQHQLPVDHDKGPVKSVVDDGPGPDKPTPLPVKEGSQPPPADNPDEGIDPDPKAPPGEIRRFEGHTQGVLGVAYSPDGRLIASVGDDNTIRLWDPRTAKELHSWQGHAAPPWSVAFSPDGRLLLTGGKDKVMRLWDVVGWNELQHFDGHTDMVDAVAFGPDKTRVYSASRDGTCRIWDADTGREVGRCGTGPMSLYALAVSRQGDRALFTAGDHSVVLWDISRQVELKRMPGHTFDVYTLAFSPDGKFGLSAGWDKTIRLWDLSDGTEKHRFDGPAPVLSVAFSPDGRRILSGGDDKAVRLWEVDTGRQICSLEGHTAGVRSVAFSPSGRYAISGSVDKTIRLWRLPPVEPPVVAVGSDPAGIDPDPKGPPGEVRHFDENPGEIRRLAVSPDGRQVITASYDNAVRLWDVASGKVVLTCAEHTGRVHAVAFLPDGRRAMSVRDAGIVQLWDLKDGHEIRSFVGHTGEVWYVAVSNDGRGALTSGRDDFAILWDVDGGKELHRLEEPGGIDSAAFSPDGRTVLTGTINGPLHLWDVKSAAKLQRFEDLPGERMSVAFSPDGKYVLSGSTEDKAAYLLRVSDGKLVRKFVGHIGNVNAVAFSPDGREVLTGGDDMTVRVWDADTGDELYCFRGHQRKVWSVAFSPDGHYGFSAGADNVIRMWRLPPAPPMDLTQQDKLKGVGEIRKFEGNAEAIAMMDVSHDGKQLLTAGFDHTLRLWDVATTHELLRWEEPENSNAHGVAFLPDGRRALSCGETDKDLHLWDLADAHEIRTFKGHAQGVLSLAVSSDGRFAASCSHESTAFLWDIETGMVLHRLEGNIGGVDRVVFSPDSKYLLTGSAQGVIRLWDVATGKEVRRIGSHVGDVKGLAFFPDGQFALSTSTDKTACVWSLKEGREVRRFGESPDGAWSAAVSPDGLRALTGDGDGTVTLWDTASGKALYRFVGQQGQVWEVAFSPDGRYAFSSGQDHMVRMWQLPPADYVPAPEPPPPVVKKPEPKPDAPAADALNAADHKVKEIYKDDFKKKKKEEVRALADKLEKDAVGTKDLAFRYVLLREARDAAARADDLTFAFHVADEMADGFAVGPLAMKLEALEAAAKTAVSANAHVHVGEASLVIAEEGVDRDDYNTADRAVKVGLSAAFAASSPTLDAAIHGRAKEVEGLHAAYTDAVQKAAGTLAEKPDDPEANLTLGKFLCLEKGDWNRGLPMLAQGSDPELKALAASDLASVSDPDAQQEVAKAYTTRAEGENGAAKAQLLRRSCYWLEKAQAQLMGFQRTEVAKKIAELEKGILPQRPAVVCAYYGTYNDWPEVTDKVRQLLVQGKGQKLIVKADAGELGIPNHDNHQTKTLVIVYQCGGQTCLSITPEGGTATIPAPAGAADTDVLWPGPGQKLLVLAAQYGAEGGWADCTSQAQHLVKGQALTVASDGLTSIDPAFGKHKALLVVYRYGNRVRFSVTPHDQPVAIGELPPKP